MSEDAHCILTAEDVQKALSRMGAEIVDRNRGVRNLALVGVRTRGEFLAKRLRECIVASGGSSQEEERVPVGVLDVTIYRDDFDPLETRIEILQTEIPFSVEGVHIVLVDDVLWTGRTVRAAMTGVMSFGRPGCISLAVLIDRKGRELPISADFVGRTVSTSPQDHVQVLLSEVDNRDEVVVSQL